jgi:hypothetical protein
MSNATPRVVFQCDDAVIPDDLPSIEQAVVQHIRTRGPEASLDLRIEDLYHLVLSEVSGRHADLVRLAAYVYRADLNVSRGGERDSDAWHWSRHLTLCIPVGDPEFWNGDAVLSALSSTLGFLTGDRWDFSFSQADPEARQLPLEIAAQDLYERPGAVTLFSGGLDSLCTLVESAMKGERPVPLGHWPSARHESRQKRLIEAIERHNPAWSLPLLGAHIVRGGKEPKESTQRSRGFLYGCLASAVAAEIGAPKVYLSDNGPISLNLPINDQLVGALASRATHPKFLDRMTKLMALVLRQPVAISNPLRFRTRSETLGILRQAKAEHLIGLTVSCSTGARLPAATPHCGGCSQCIDRRFATIAAKMERYDPAEKYQQDVFLDVLNPWERATTAYSYVRFARTVSLLDEDALFTRFMELLDVPVSIDMSAEEAMREALDLIKRHATTVLGVLEVQSTRYLSQLVSGRVSAASLIGKVMGEQAGRRVVDRPPQVVVLPPSDPIPVGLTSAPRGSAGTDIEEPCAILAWQGKGWRVRFAGKETLLNQSVGTQRLAKLLRDPGREFTPEELDAPFDRASQTEPIPDLLQRGFHVETAGEADPIIDADTVKACKKAIAELGAKHVAASDKGDAERAAEIAEEIRRIRTYLRAATGLAGKIRDEPTPSRNRYRAVRVLIRRSLETIQQQHRALGTHLDHSLTLKGPFSYAPSEPVSWVVELP